MLSLPSVRSPPSSTTSASLVATDPVFPDLTDEVIPDLIGDPTSKTKNNYNMKRILILIAGAMMLLLASCSQYKYETVKGDPLGPKI